MPSAPVMTWETIDDPFELLKWPGSTLTLQSRAIERGGLISMAHALLYDPQEDKTAGRWCVSNAAEVILKGQTEITEDKRHIFQHNAVDNVLN